MVVAVIALIAALAGTATAAKVLPVKKFKKQAVKSPITYVTASQIVNNNNIPGPNTPGVNITAVCPKGFFPTGGGVKTSALSAFSGLFVQQSYPSTENGWTANVYAGFVLGGTAQPETVSVTAICVRVQKRSGNLQAITL